MHYTQCATYHILDAIINKNSSNFRFQLFNFKGWENLLHIIVSQFQLNN